MVLPEGSAYPERRQKEMSALRKLKVGAIQPGYHFPPPVYDCMRDSYRNDAGEIVERYIKKQLQISFDLLERVGHEGCDVVTTCEDMCGTGIFSADTTKSNIFPELLEITAPMAEKGLCELARKHSMAIIGCYNKRIAGMNFNVATIFDKKGNIAGEYRKTHLPSNEKWQLSEGDSLNVFDVGFGKIGVCICYDMMFPEVVEAEALQGAEIIFHPTAGYGWYDSIGEATLRTRANDNSVYIVTAKNYVHNAAGKSSVIDFWGHVLADAGFYRNVIVTKEIDLDEKKTQPEWFNPVQITGIADVRERHLRERRPELYGRLVSSDGPRLAVPNQETQEEIIGRIKSGQCRWQ